MQIEGRKELFRALVGSHNYNLNREGSDMNYKVFTIPSFFDLYSNKKFSKTLDDGDINLNVYDIREVEKSWLYTPNINFLEVLFSDEIIVNPELKYETKEWIDILFRHKSEIIKMNLSLLYQKCIDMYKSHRGNINKVTMGINSNQQLIDQFNYDTKKAVHSLRILYFLQKFADSEFTDFKKSIWFDSNEFKSKRDILFAIKDGLCTKGEYLELSNIVYNRICNTYKEKYVSQVDKAKELSAYISSIIMAIVQRELSM